MNDQDIWITPEDVARFEGCSIRSVQNRCKNGELPAEKDSQQRWRINRKQYELLRGDFMLPPVNLVNPEQLTRKIAEAIRQTIITFTNFKGGVGKTSLCCILGDYLAVHGYRTLIIDNDPQGNSTYFCGLRPYSGTAKLGKYEFKTSIYDVYINEIYKAFNVKNQAFNVFDAIYKTPRENLFIMPVDAKSEVIKYWILENMHRFKSIQQMQDAWKNHFPFLLKRALDKIRNQFDIILCDTPPELGFMTTNALISSTDAIVPIELGSYELTGLGRALNNIKNISQINKNLSLLGIVISRFGPTETKLDKDLKAKLLSDPSIGHNLYQYPIIKSQLIRQSTYNQESVFETFNKSYSEKHMDAIEKFCEETHVRLIRKYANPSYAELEEAAAIEKDQK